MVALPVPRAAADNDVCFDLFRGGRRPIVCFANDWKTDPTSKHHVMRTYSAYTDVVWLESTGIRRPRLLKLTDQRRILHRLRSSAKGIRTGGERVHVVSPLIVPLPGNVVADRINAALYRSSIRRALATLDTKELPLLWAYAPNVATYLKGIPRSGLVYHCVDRWWAFSDHNASAMRTYHRQLCEQADVVFASSLALLNDCLEHNSSSYLIPHGVDWQHFAQAAIAPPERPQDLADVKGPILGFFGLIHEWVDQDLLCRIATAFPEATLALIGRAQVDVSRLRAMPNIRLLGQKTFAELPAYCAAFDVGLIPFHFNDLTAAVNPIKLREYLSAGVPVVASALPDIVAVENPSLITARNTNDFVAGIGSLLAQGRRSPAHRRAASLGMKSESWDGRCAQMAALVMEHVGA
jgi:glycosyltransferase involved in cell wall biosynthesis